MSKIDLLSELRRITDDDQEIFAVIAGHCANMAQKVNRFNSIEFWTTEKTPQLAMSVRVKDGKITAVTPHASLSNQASWQAFLENARAELAPKHGSHVVSRYLFSRLPLRGIYVWRDRLRLRPCSPDANIGPGKDWCHSTIGMTHEADPSFGPPFPFLMEVKVNKSSNPLLDANRQFRTLDTYQYALTLLLAGDIKYAQSPENPIWVALKGEQSEPEYHLANCGFGDPNGGLHEDFPTCEEKNAPFYDKDDYYERLWTRNDELQIPTSLSDSLDLIDQLERKSLQKFRRACYWFSVGVQFRNAEALAVPAFSAAVECLLPNPSSITCPTCKKPQGERPTELFRRHINLYGQVPEKLKRQANALYGARSALVHGRHASAVDVDVFGFDHERHWQNLLIWIVAQRSLIGWLEDSNRENWHLENA